jgi:hypothetical protein
MKLVAASLTVGVMVLAGCGQAGEIAGQAATAAASAAAGEVGRQAEQALGPVCRELSRADKSLSALAQGKDQTVAEAKRQVADAQADLTGGSAAESIAAEAAVAGITSALDGLALSWPRPVASPTQSGGSRIR